MIVVKDTNYLIKTRIDVGQFFGGEPADAFIELREPTNRDLNALMKAAKLGDNDAVLSAFKDCLPRIILSHNLAKPGNSPLVDPPLMSNSEVCDLIIDRFGLYTEIVRRYLKDVVFTLAPKSAEQSDGSPEESSEGTK
jgi:hypothetical protein